MGSIYKVQHRLLDEIRVIKVMRPHTIADPDLKRRFIEEAKTATRLKHPNLCTIHDFSVDDDGTAYLVMEFIDGVPLGDLVKAGTPPSLPVCLEIAHQALLALNYLHKKSIVHRDIAPDNLMLFYEEDRAKIKLIDLGIAKSVDKAQGDGKTVAGTFLGKLSYASPEQFGSLAPEEVLDGRSDLYSLGVVLYELLTLQRPIVSEQGPVGYMKAHILEPPTPFAKTDPEGKVPEDVREVVIKALAKKREDRWDSAEDLDREIMRLIRKYGQSSDGRTTAEIVASMKASKTPSGVNVTPSAQRNLDMRFGQGSTPSPTPLPGSTTTKPGTAPRPMPHDPTQKYDGKAPRQRKSLGLPIVAGVAVLAAVVGGIVATGGGKAKPTPAALPTEVPPTAPPPTEPPPPTATPISQAPTAAPVATVPAGPSAAQIRADVYRKSIADARQRAEREKAPTAAAALFNQAGLAERDAQKLYDRKQFEAAQAAYERGTQLFQEAERDARSAADRAKGVASVPTAAPTVVERIVEKVATPTPEPVRPTKTPVPVEAAAPSDDQKIRETIARFAQAYTNLDLDAYVGAYPKLASQREKLKAAFDGSAAQTLVVQVLAIERKSATEALARCAERRTIKPKVGDPVNQSRESSIRLEKRGDGWFIVGLK